MNEVKCFYRYKLIQLITDKSVYCIVLFSFSYIYILSTDEVSEKMCLVFCLVTTFHESKCINIFTVKNIYVDISFNMDVLCKIFKLFNKKLRTSLHF